LKRIFDAKLRKVGNSYVITVPKDTIDRFDIEEGDYLALTLDTNEIKKKDKKER
jgi:putative addiction module antidote